MPYFSYRNFLKIEMTDYFPLRLLIYYGIINHDSYTSEAVRLLIQGTVFQDSYAKFPGNETVVDSRAFLT